MIFIPVQECQENNKPGYKYGERGKCYTYTPGNEESRNHAKQKAYLQGAAIAHETGETLKASDGKMPKKKSFTNPFPEGEPDQLEGNALIRALELDIAMEHDAAAVYMAHADKTSDSRVKETLESIAYEELVHVGEFESLIDYVTGGEYGSAIEEGVAEAGKSVKKSVLSRIRKVDDFRRWVTGVVLEPDTVDLQGDVITKEDVRRAMEGYMLQSQTVGHQHETIAPASVVECYLANDDFYLDGKELVRKGSWVLTVKVFSDSIWNDVITGKITGFSIGGKGIRSDFHGNEIERFGD